MKMTTMEKLERLRNRGTKYELTADGVILAGYCSHGKMNILKMLQKNGEAWAKRINENDMITFANDGKSAKIGRFEVRFSGRTQREAIISGELPWFEDAISI
jgi:hypothetical protein